ncbi:MAG: hypothetical protein IJ187_06130 [Neisseriaceae bacterium]|nr:hypothetical protein [Neisseriaceae bacterium]
MKKILISILGLSLLSGCSVCAHSVAGDCMPKKYRNTKDLDIKDRPYPLNTFNQNFRQPEK